MGQVINVVHVLGAMNLNKALWMIMFVRKYKILKTKVIRCGLEYLNC